MATQSHITRRSILAGFGASIPAAAVAGVSPNLGAPLDEDLLALGRRWEAAAAAYIAHLDAFNAAEARYLASKPAKPEALKRMPSDRDLRLSSPISSDDGFFTGEHVRSFRSKRRMKSVEYAITEAERIRLNYPTDAHILVRSEPWPEAQARADEIVTAWDEWQAGIARARQESGLETAEEENTRLHRAEADLREEITRKPARTIEGIMLKARVYAWLLDGEGQIENELERQLEANGPTDETIGLAIVRDLLRRDRLT